MSSDVSHLCLRPKHWDVWKETFLVWKLNIYVWKQTFMFELIFRPHIYVWLHTLVCMEFEHLRLKPDKYVWAIYTYIHLCMAPYFVCMGFDHLCLESDKYVWNQTNNMFEPYISSYIYVWPHTFTSMDKPLVSMKFEHLCLKSDTYVWNQTGKYEPYI